MLLKIVQVLAVGLLALTVSGQFVAPAGTYVYNVNPFVATMNIKADMSFIESFDTLASTNPVPACVIAGILGKAGNSVLSINVAGGEGCGPVFNTAGFSIGAATYGSGGAISISYTNRSGKFTSPITPSTRIADGLYTTAKGASISAFLKVQDSKYYFAWNASGVNFGCFATGTLIGGPVNTETVDDFYGTANWQATDSSKCAGVSKVSYAGGKVTVTFTKGSAVLSVNSAAAWAQQQTYCGVIGQWSVNVFAFPDSSMYLQFLPNAAPAQKSADYCVIKLGYARTLDGSLRSAFLSNEDGDCDSALAALNSVTKLTWTATTIVVTTAGGPVTLQNSQCFTPPQGSYGGTGGGYNAAVNVLPNRAYQFLLGASTKTSFDCADFGSFVNSTSSALFIVGNGGCSSLLPTVTKMSFASNQFTLSGVDAARKSFTIVLK